MAIKRFDSLQAAVDSCKDDDHVGHNGAQWCVGPLADLMDDEHIAFPMKWQHAEATLLEMTRGME